MEEKEILKQDSYTIGTSGKSGAIKIYYDLSTMTDEEVKKLCTRAKGLYAFLGGQ